MTCVVSALAIALLPSSSAMAAGGPGAVLKSAGPVVPNSYIVVLDDGAVTARGTSGFTVPMIATDFAARYGGRVGFVYEHALKGFSIQLPEAAASAMARDPRVRFVQQDGLAELVATQTPQPAWPVPWNLDRIDQRDLPLNDAYTYNFNAVTVHVYVLDTGIRSNHGELLPRVSPQGFTAFADGNGLEDCHGHGTHVAGVVAGFSVGVAKQATVHSVRVANCAGSGSSATVMAGVEWVTANAIKPAVANMSLRLPAGCPAAAAPDEAVDLAVRGSIASGVTYVVAAGNCGTNGPPASRDACNFSPSRVAEALTVGASDAADVVASFSSQGPCVDLFAPGVEIRSAWNDGGYLPQSGTSQATPHVSGIAALFLNEVGDVPPALVHENVVASATPGKLSGFLPDVPGSPNLLAFSLFGAADRVQLWANYRPLRAAPRTIFTSTRENPPEFHFWYDESLGSFEQRPGGACYAGQNNPSYLYVRTSSPTIRSCRYQASWDAAPVQCPREVVSLLNSGTLIVLNTDRWQRNPSTCALYTPLREILPFGQVGWLRMDLVTADGSTYTRRVNFVKDP
ncbi:MAG TPA: S8 family peptidase [Vicinamibacteria bacterium]|nr:S8 family peptidase [Vicinamibacteria bacterium]